MVAGNPDQLRKLPPEFTQSEVELIGRVGDVAAEDQLIVGMGAELLDRRTILFEGDVEVADRVELHSSLICGPDAWLPTMRISRGFSAIC